MVSGCFVIAVLVMVRGMAVMFRGIARGVPPL
jgi:hypothetical protein